MASGTQQTRQEQTKHEVAERVGGQGRRGLSVAREEIERVN